MDILEKIIATKREELAQLRAERAFADTEREALACRRQAISFKGALLASSSGIIAEFKRRSPSRGFIHEGADVAQVTCGYERSGAAALSVLTDERYFGGALGDLRTARQGVSLPILRKDFVIDPYQICQARIAGADAILLIAAALSPRDVRELAAYAHSLSLEVLLEIHNAGELDHICPEVDVVGVNNRNLKTFVTDVRASHDLAERIPAGFVRISESGISDPATVRGLRDAGFRGFLMGENFMKQSDPAAALGQFIAAL
ncbi:MAG: indole-3-glycerol phosphate synthase TrpC [Rikenellaceae bacterium]|nr:indole-3-glycerol phosphate synthase TrpC [Rikenellaceae bacterium]